MHTQSIDKTERLAKIGRLLGIVSSIFLVLTVLLGLWIRFSDFDEIRKLALFGWVVLTFIGNLITGIPGCIIAIIALSRNKAEGDNADIRQMAIWGLVLSVLGVIIAAVIFIFALIFSSNNPPPPIVTPIPSTAVP